MEEKKYSRIHNVIMEDREHLSVSGVTDVSEFNEMQIILVTEMGMMTVEGENLRISELSIETGDMKIDGTVNSIIYSEEDLRGVHTSLWSKLFR
ncbi:MAG: sporulation protein YabP [Clostridia bacterium]|nr:sporulation protein YabP [Clostridia bacterium]